MFQSPWQIPKKAVHPQTNNTQSLLCHLQHMITYMKKNCTSSQTLENDDIMNSLEQAANVTILISVVTQQKPTSALVAKTVTNFKII